MISVVNVAATTAAVRTARARQAIHQARIGILKASLESGEIACFRCGHIGPADHFEPGSRLHNLNPHLRHCPEIGCGCLLDLYGYVDSEGLHQPMVRERCGNGSS